MDRDFEVPPLMDEGQHARGFSFMQGALDALVHTGNEANVQHVGAQFALGVSAANAALDEEADAGPGVEALHEALRGWYSYSARIARKPGDAVAVLRSAYREWLALRDAEVV